MSEPVIWPRPVTPFPRKVDADWELADSMEARSFLLGVNSNGEVVNWDTRFTPNLLVAGTSGSGRSSLMRTVVVEALMHDYQLVVIDPSEGGADFKPWAEKRSAVFTGVQDYRGTEAAMMWVEREMAQRIMFMAKHGYTNIMEASESERPSRILVVFDAFDLYLHDIELVSSNVTNDPRIAEHNRKINHRNMSILRTLRTMARISVQGRTSGINMILGVKRLAAQEFDRFPGGKLLVKTTGRVVLGAHSPTDLISDMNLNEASRMQNDMINAGVPIGRGVYETAQGELTDLQSWWSGDDESIEKVLAPVPSAKKVDLTEFMSPVVG